MPEITRPLPALFDPDELDAASAAFCHQFGDVSAELWRRAAVRDLLGSARHLAQALENYARAAGLHARGVHCAADMQRESLTLSHAFQRCSESVNAASATYRDWQEGGLVAESHASSGALPLPPSEVRV
jgi:hypothetical protein